ADLGMNTLSSRSVGGTDHLSFDRAGLPGWQFIQDRLDYQPIRHHTNMDVYDGLDPEDLMINAVIMAGFAYHTAMRDERLPRKPYAPPSR
ncbi:MAG: peptidase M28, partial [Acidobacteriota bacterium]